MCIEPSNLSTIDRIRVRVVNDILPVRHTVRIHMRMNMHARATVRAVHACAMHATDFAVLSALLGKLDMAKMAR